MDEKKDSKKKLDKYYFAVGRRKTSSATVRLYEGKGDDTFNGKNFKELYPNPNDQKNLYHPLNLTDNRDNFYFSIRAKGGGTTGQLEAGRLAIARALVEYSESLKSELKQAKLLTRDDRKVERKKAGLRKARKAPQYSKR